MLPWMVRINPRSKSSRWEDKVASVYNGLFCFVLQDLGENIIFAKPNIFCHFAQGIGDPKYLPVSNVQSLNKLLVEALDSYNEVNAVMNLVSEMGAEPERKYCS